MGCFLMVKSAPGKIGADGYYVHVDRSWYSEVGIHLPLFPTLGFTGSPFCLQDSLSACPKTRSTHLELFVLPVAPNTRAPKQLSAEGIPILARPRPPPSLLARDPNLSLRLF
jgi:hypothetical protein